MLGISHSELILVFQLLKGNDLVYNQKRELKSIFYAYFIFKLKIRSEQLEHHCAISQFHFNIEVISNS